MLSEYYFFPAFYWSYISSSTNSDSSPSHFLSLLNLSPPLVYLRHIVSGLLQSQCYCLEVKVARWPLTPGTLYEWNTILMAHYYFCHLLLVPDFIPLSPVAPIKAIGIVVIPMYRSWPPRNIRHLRATPYNNISIKMDIVQ